MVFRRDPGAVNDVRRTLTLWRAGAGSGILDALIMGAKAAGYDRIRLDSPDFVTTAHALYRSRGFVEIGPYAESEIPDRLKSNWVFMERTRDRAEEA